MKKTIHQQPAQHQNKQPGIEHIMHPKPQYLSSDYKGSEKLINKTALITGGDSGIGRAVACAFAMEGADVVIHYLNEHKDAKKTEEIIKKIGSTCWLMPSNLQTYAACESLIKMVIKKCKKIDILVNNIAEQHPQDTLEEISCEQLEKTFKTNFFSYFYMIKALLPHFKKGSVIINTA